MQVQRASVTASQDKPPGTKRPQRVRQRKPDARVAHVHNLQTHVHRLHQEVESLKLTRALLMDRHLQRADQVGGSFERTIRQFFEVFQFGMEADFSLDPPMPSPIPATYRKTQTEDFARAIMDKDVNSLGGPLAGIDAFIEQNKLYSAAFAHNRLKMLEVKVFPIEGEFMTWQNQHVTVTGWGEYSCYITHKTIDMLFPHVKYNRELVEKLVGQYIKGVGRYDFVFDTATNRVVATTADLNFVPVFMVMLRNPHEVAMLLDDAQITSEYIIGGGDHDDEQDQGFQEVQQAEAVPTQRIGKIRMEHLLC